MEGSLVAYKVFTNGSTLQASEVNENLMQQAVATFSNAAARTAAITSPIEGQLTYLLDVDRYDHWNGSSWVSPFGMTLLNATPFTAASSVSVNNVLTSQYDNYKIIVSIVSGSGNGELALRMRLGTTDNSSNDYKFGQVYIGAIDSLALGGSNALTTNFFGGGFFSGTSGMGSEITLYKPSLAEKTSFTTTSGGRYLSFNAGSMTDSTAYDGFTIYPIGANMTGTVKTYGLRNA
jgi:hypothetical protein